MHGTVKVNHNKLPWATGEVSTAELVGVAYARASKPTNASWSGRPQLQGRLRVRRAGPPGRRQQGTTTAVKLKNCRSPTPVDFRKNSNPSWNSTVQVLQTLLINKIIAKRVDTHVDM
ncbi:hypothetical protein TRIUR3_33698 [Triticum urartu]|uniref:Uncharacterized protein n=1 Tax=Triticum urartu TaxID=4572 RepID=M7YQV4_TRIUA|nr:hypothetical protein TRIUR3_33698 [Triticum urartu]